MHDLLREHQEETKAIKFQILPNPLSTPWKIHALCSFLTEFCDKVSPLSAEPKEGVMKLLCLRLVARVTQE